MGKQISQFGVAVLASLVLPMVAFGQTPAEKPSAAPLSEIGQVVSVEGPDGSVIVFRGSRSYSLSTGDVLFAGDRVLTRSNGKAVLSSRDCEREVGNASSIVVDAAFCRIEVVQLVPPAAAGTAPAAASPTLIPLLALGSGGAAALAASNSSNSESIGLAAVSN